VWAQEENSQGIVAPDSASHMQDGIGPFLLFLQYIDGLLCRENEQVNLSTVCFKLYFLHDWQSPATRADH
jgi:hypothetical protein